MAQEVKDKDIEMVDWWAGTVILAFFPMIVALIASLCIYGTVDINRLIGDGELIISAFLVTTPSLISYYRNASKESSHKKNFLSLTVRSFFSISCIYIYKNHTRSSRKRSLYCLCSMCNFFSYSVLAR